MEGVSTQHYVNIVGPSKASASFLSVGVRTSCWAARPPPDAPRAAGKGCWSGGGSPGSGPRGGRRSTARAESPGWISSSPWRCACRRRREGPSRTAGRNGEESGRGQAACWGGLSREPVETVTFKKQQLKATVSNAVIIQAVNECRISVSLQLMFEMTNRRHRQCFQQLVRFLHA